MKIEWEKEALILAFNRLEKDAINQQKALAYLNIAKEIANGQKLKNLDDAIIEYKSSLASIRRTQKEIVAYYKERYTDEQIP